MHGRKFCMRWIIREWPGPSADGLGPRMALNTARPSTDPPMAWVRLWPRTDGGGDGGGASGGQSSGGSGGEGGSASGCGGESEGESEGEGGGASGGDSSGGCRGKGWSVTCLQSETAAYHPNRVTGAKTRGDRSRWCSNGWVHWNGFDTTSQIHRCGRRG